MRTRSRQLSAARTITSGALFIALSCALVYAAPATPPSADATPPSQPGQARSVEQIKPELQQAGMELQALITSPTILIDEAKRNDVAPKLLPPIRKLLALSKELENAPEPEGKMMAKRIQPQMLTLAALLDDADAAAQLDAQAKSADPTEAIRAQSAQLLVRWWKASKDAAAQGKVADDAAALAKKNPQSNELSQSLLAMSKLGAATPELGDRVGSIVSDTMTSPAAQQAKSQIDADKKLKSVENKPLTIAGKTVDGKDFSTADWKGKVVLVDFWATWCGPCKEELPRMKKAYKDFHDKGLEILGVSNDFKAEDLKQFVAADPEMPWPHLFDAAAAEKREWNPITSGFGINGIPTMFLIDKKGVCRTVEARENFEEMIPKLLSE